MLDFAKVCHLSNLMVLISFLMLFWPQKVIVTLGGILITQMLRTPLRFFKSCQILLKICTLSISTVLWIHFWCYFDSQTLLWPSGGILTPKMLRNTPWFLDVVGFCLNFALNFFEFWLFPGNQSYWVLLSIFSENY